MRACEHYLAAEELLNLDGRDIASVPTHEARVLIAAAQVHATLAAAGASALNAYSDGTENELGDWEAAAGGKG